MRLILIGPPGVGKGTQAINLKNHYGIVHLSTGVILRSEMTQGTAIGEKARSYIDQGQLVPDDILLDIMEHRLQQDDCKPGYLLDGFPRTIPQAEGLDAILKKLRQSLNAVVSLVADADELVMRLVLRGKDSGRSDDTPEVIKKRQKVYWDLTSPLLKYYRSQHLLKEVDGTGNISEITYRIIQALEK